MTRQEAINHIDNLFPIDSDYPKTNAIGERLLKQAKLETQNWRDILPDATLIRYAELCIDEHNRQSRKSFMKG